MSACQAELDTGRCPDELEHRCVDCPLNGIEFVTEVDELTAVAWFEQYAPEGFRLTLWQKGVLAAWFSSQRTPRRPR